MWARPLGQRSRLFEGDILSGADLEYINDLSKITARGFLVSCAVVCKYFSQRENRSFLTIFAMLLANFSATISITSCPHLH